MLLPLRMIWDQQRGLWLTSEEARELFLLVDRGPASSVCEQRQTAAWSAFAHRSPGMLRLSATPCVIESHVARHCTLGPASLHERDKSPTTVDHPETCNLTRSESPYEQRRVSDRPLLRPPGAARLTHALGQTKAQHWESRIFFWSMQGGKENKKLDKDVDAE